MMMEANEFIAKLKVAENAEEVSDIGNTAAEYKTILSKLVAEDRGFFSLNVLCMLCRNLDKSQPWRDNIDNQSLLTLAIECIRETRALQDKQERVKTLACIYHLHKYAVRQNKPVPPELIFKISYMPFELETKHLLKDYYKTYGNILTDRIVYIDRLKSKVNIAKLLPKIIEDITKTIEIYNTVEFCSNLLVFIIVKLHSLYSALSNNLSQIFIEIFTKLSTQNDLKLFKKLSERETTDMYVKLSECFYIIVENCSRNNFKDQLNAVVNVFIMLVEHSTALVHCLQTFYVNGFCSIFKENMKLSCKKKVLNELLRSIEITRKLGYLEAIHVTYPYLSQLLRLYIEYNVANCTDKPWKSNFDEHIQGCCLKLIKLFITNTKNNEQRTKCENCKVKSGLHDALRLSFVAKYFITISITQNILITELLPSYEEIVLEQHAIMTELNELGCENYEKCFRKLQTDVHNTAIALNKAQYFECSIKLFDVYLNYELKCAHLDSKNVSRALYNKSICELDCKMYARALVNAYLSLIFSQDLKTDKYMSLVIDIKAKELKSKQTDDDEEIVSDNIQLISVLDACKIALDQELYNNLGQCMAGIKFSELLKHEFTAYSRMWPAMAPIGGVWKSLLALYDGLHDGWITGLRRITSKQQNGGISKEEFKDGIENILFEVILTTPSVVRTVHSEYLTAAVGQLLSMFDNMSSVTADRQLVHATLLLLQCEYDLALASKKYDWKANEPSTDPDQVLDNRTIRQEHAGTARAIVAVKLLTRLLPDMQLVSKSYLQPALQVLQVSAALLLTLTRTMEALQLAHICCQVALILEDDAAYLRNLGTLVSHCTPSVPLERYIRRAEGARGAGGADTVLFLCDLAMYNIRRGAWGAGGRLVRLAQAHVLTAYQHRPDAHWEVAVGRVLEAHSLLLERLEEGGWRGSTALSALNGAQRHYLALHAQGSKWTARRLHSLTLRLHTSECSMRAARLTRALLLWKRAQIAAAVVLRTESGVNKAALYAEITDPANFDDAQVKIDSRLKNVLGLPATYETEGYYITTTTKQAPSTPKEEIEPMRDCMLLKRTQTSPSDHGLSYIAAFKIPDFFYHDSECACYACDIPFCLILACKASGLEAAMYSRANETQIAKNYFDGVMKMLSIVDEKVTGISNKYKEIYEDFIVDSVMATYKTELKTTQVQVLVDLSFFELKNENYHLVDDNVVRIHEIVAEMKHVDKYLINAVMNLMTTSARLKKTIKKSVDTGLETEFESLALSPAKETTNVELLMTPISKPMRLPEPAPNIIVKDEEVPKKHRIIKLESFDLDDSSDEKNFEKPTRSTRRAKKTEFKVPNPTTSKATLEIATPRPKIIISQPSAPTPRSVPRIVVGPVPKVMATPKPLETRKELDTPIATSEQFFTPMTSIKTYSKKPIRNNIVKQLDHELSSPKPPKLLDKENATTSNMIQLKVPTKSKAKKEIGGKLTLKRATSPGKLCKEKKELGTRSRRLRQCVNFSVDDDKT